MGQFCAKKESRFAASVDRLQYAYQAATRWLFFYYSSSEKGCQAISGTVWLFRVIAFPFLFFMVDFGEGTAFADALIVLGRIAADHLRLFHGDAEMFLDKIDGGEDRQKGIPLAAARTADIGDGGQRFRGGAAGEIHIGGCVGDLYDAALYLFRFRDPLTLMRDTGPKQSFYLRE